MFPEFEVCNTTRSTITESHFLGTVGVLKVPKKPNSCFPTNYIIFCLYRMIAMCRTKKLSFRSIAELQNIFSNFSTGEIASVKGTQYDLTTPVCLGDRVNEIADDLGYDHNFCFGKTGEQKHVAW